MLKVIWKIANACHIDRCQLSGVSDKEKKLNAAAFKGETSRANLFAQPTAQAVLFSTLVCSLGLVPTSPSFWVNVNPQKSHGPGLLTLIKLLLQAPQRMSLSELTKMGTPRGLRSLAPLGSLQA